MRIIKTHETDLGTLPDFDRACVYNGLDTLVTQDVFNATFPQLDKITRQTYEQGKALQGPVLEMRIRGVLVDQVRRSEVIDELSVVSEMLTHRLERIALDGVGMPSFNPNSHDDLQTLFYRHLGLSPIFRHGRPTTDRAARERLEAYPIATQLVRHINALTEIGDKISVLRTALDPDGRIRTSYNIAGTSTGRFSSSLSEFGTGGNLQNVEESLRSIFIADPGYKFAKCDAKSGESFCVGAVEWNRFSDGTFLNAVESGDVHTAVARIVWPGLGWTGDLRTDKSLAESPFYRHHSYRYMCKKLGHGRNYAGQPPTLAEQSRLPLEVVIDFCRKYDMAFPAHELWRRDVEHKLRSTGHLTTLTGRRRWFLGRRTDPAVLREAIAYDPQGSLADIVNTAMLNIWREQKQTIRPIHIVMHDHDALTFMYPEETEDDVIPYLLQALVVPIPLSQSRTLQIPYDVEVGWNKGHYDPSTNPDGLRPYRGHDDRRRQPIRKLLNYILGAKNKCPPPAGSTTLSPPSPPPPSP